MGAVKSTFLIIGGSQVKSSPLLEGQIIVQPCHDINPSEAGIKLPEAKDLVGVKHIKHGVKLVEKKEGMDGEEEEEEERSKSRVGESMGQGGKRGEGGSS